MANGVRGQSIEQLLETATRLAAAGKQDDAFRLFDAALAINPRSAEAAYCVGNIALQFGWPERAAGYLKRAVALNRNTPDYHAQLGAAFIGLNRLAEAADAVRRALKLKPNHAEARCNLGVVLARQGAHLAAIDQFRAAIRLKDNVAAYHINLSVSLAALQRHDEAIEVLSGALDRHPEFSGVARALGRMLQDRGSVAQAAAFFAKAFERDPTRPEHLLSSRLYLPAISESAAQIAERRSQFAAALCELQTLPGKIDRPAHDFCRRFFFLAYHGEADRPLMEAACRLFRKLSPVLNYVAPVAAQRPPCGDGRIRLGIVSEFLSQHTIGMLTRGLIEQLDRQRFTIVIIHAPGGAMDVMRQSIDACADEVVVLENDLAAAQRAVAALRLDVLHYPDIGMSNFTYFLAYARLAPVQTVSWGHPVTTGLDSIDYFLSFGAAEPADAEQHYSERLVRLDRPPVHYKPFDRLSEILPKRALGLPETGALYLCPQTLFKFHPDFDAVLADILHKDPSGWIIALESQNPAAQEILRQRWAEVDPVLLERVLFLPRQPGDRFLMLLTHGDVMLDPPHFGSGNTLYESLFYGIPSVTWPGRFMRGRITAGVYDWLGIADAPVAASLADYADLAVAIATDRSRRERLRDELIRKSPGLYHDRLAVREFEAFLEAAVAARSRDGTLEGWNRRSEAA
jgi:protein O-GlcNAc transferase